MNKMNNIQEWPFHLSLKNYMDDFQDPLRSSGNTTINQRCVSSLLTEVYKYIHGLSEVMN